MCVQDQEYGIIQSCSPRSTSSSSSSSSVSPLNACEIQDCTQSIIYIVGLLVYYHSMQDLVYAIIQTDSTSSTTTLLTYSMCECRTKCTQSFKYIVLVLVLVCCLIQCVQDIVYAIVMYIWY